MSTPSLRDRIRPLALQGLAPVEIERQYGLPRRKVARVMQKLREAGEPIPVPRRGRPIPPSITVFLSEAEATALVAEARRRGLTRPQYLARRLLETIARDGLFAAVLD